MKKEYRDNPLVKHSIEFSLMIIKYVEVLERERKFIIANQLLRSATSVGANIMEAQSAESKNDFVHKLKIADKEEHETWYWLYLCQQSEGYYFENTLLDKLDEILRLLHSIIIKCKKEVLS